MISPSPFASRYSTTSFTVEVEVIAEFILSQSQAKIAEKSLKIKKFPLYERACSLQRNRAKGKVNGKLKLKNKGSGNFNKRLDILQIMSIKLLEPTEEFWELVCKAQSRTLLLRQHTSFAVHYSISLKRENEKSIFLDMLVDWLRHCSVEASRFQF